MKIYVFIFCALATLSLWAQKPVNPVIKSFGTVSSIPYATVKLDTSIEYKIIVDVMTGSDDKSEVFFSMNNVARMFNLHVLAGVPKEQMHVVLAIHNAAVWSVLTDARYKELFGLINPHTPLIKELIDNGVKVVVCGQSLIKQKIAQDQLLEGVEVATSALTIITEYQLRGYAVLRF
jgi:intracellular sulfur oxidation DsrE/DsrF family protein